MRRILIAGVGNIFFGDDGFGVEVLRALAGRPLPDQVAIKDFGIRGYDFACALSEDYEAVILVDAVPRGEAPGTVYLLEANTANLKPSAEASLDAHSLDPVRCLQMAQRLGNTPRRLYVVGCEPEPLGASEGRIGLSDQARMAVPQALEMIESLLGKLLGSDKSIGAGAMSA